MSSEKLIEARSTVNMLGWPANTVRLVDENDPIIAARIAKTQIVPVAKPKAKAEAKPKDEKKSEPKDEAPKKKDSKPEFVPCDNCDGSCTDECILEPKS